MILDKVLIKLFGTPSDRYLKKVTPIVEEINAKYDSMNDISDDGLRERTQEMISLIADRRNEAKQKAEESNLSSEAADAAIFEAEQETLNELKVEAFAIVKQTCKRLVGKKIDIVGNEVEWNMIPFDVQLLGADVLHNGNIAEMKTGEGKTLVATNADIS